MYPTPFLAHWYVYPKPARMVGDTCTRREKHHKFATLRLNHNTQYQKVAFEVIGKGRKNFSKPPIFF